MKRSLAGIHLFIIGLSVVSTSPIAPVSGGLKGVTNFILNALPIFPLPGGKPVALTTYGLVRGFQVPTNSSNPAKSTANVFLGIPFAKPPVGSLRFEKPQPPNPWLFRDATSYGPVCHQMSRALEYPPDQMTYSEDCLYLNVIAPNWRNTESRSGFATMVYIHGGGYTIGGAPEYSHQFFAQNYLPRDVIIVTVQYRLAQFGFASLENTDLKGNYGLWDQVAALKFVKNNIALFGGDPNRVTIFGHSAGGASVGHLTSSPHADGLYNNAIQMSGSPYAEWATTDRNNASIDLASVLGCSGSGVKACLKSKTTDELLDATYQTGLYRQNALNFFMFAPRIDGDFHPKSISESLQQSRSKRPTLIGVADGEGLEFTIGAAYSALNNMYVPPEQYDNFTKDSFKDTITRLIANAANVGSSLAAQQLLDRIVTFYIDQAAQHAPPVQYANVGNATDGPFYVRQYSKVVSDLMFLVPALVDAKTKAKAGWPTYLYRYGYLNTDSVLEPNRPVYVVCAHMGEFPYIFNIYYDLERIPFNANDLKFQNNYLNTFTTFAKTSNPTTTSSATWPKLVSNNLVGLPHVEIAPTLAAKNNLGIFTKTLEFWEDIRSDFDFPDAHWFSTN